MGNFILWRLGFAVELNIQDSLLSSQGTFWYKMSYSWKCFNRKIEIDNQTRLYRVQNRAKHASHVSQKLTISKFFFHLHKHGKINDKNWVKCRNKMLKKSTLFHRIQINKLVSSNLEGTIRIKNYLLSSYVHFRRLSRGVLNYQKQLGDNFDHVTSLENEIAFLLTQIALKQAASLVRGCTTGVEIS